MTRMHFQSCQSRKSHTHNTCVCLFTLVGDYYMKALPIMPEQEVTHAQHMCLFVYTSGWLLHEGTSYHARAGSHTRTTHVCLFTLVGDYYMKALPIMPEQEVTHAQHMCLFVYTSGWLLHEGTSCHAGAGSHTRTTHVSVCLQLVGDYYMKALPIMPEQEVTHAQHMCLFVYN